MKTTIPAAIVYLLAAAALAAAGENDLLQQVEVTVGIDDGDFRGSDGRLLQAAVDYVGNLGGGTVRIGPGRIEMRDSLKLRNRVRLIGTPGKTLLVSCKAQRSLLAVSGDTNERQITLVEPAGFRIGDGIMVQDDTSMYGFACTQATITAKLNKNTFRISRPLSRDYAPDRNARVTSGFPVIGLWNADHVTIEGITIDGNGDHMEYLTGCRGGGIYLFECENVHIRNCTVRNYNGDAISFQTTRDVLIEDCVCEANRGVGLHPGCGTEHAIVRRTRCSKNGGDGLFLCVRVKHCRFEHNILSDNERHGISIGLKDSDNQFLHNVITSNAKSGVHFRRQAAAGGAHRNVFVENRILDNGLCVEILGEHHELQFRENKIGYSRPVESKSPALQAAEAQDLTLTDNEFIHIEAK